MTPSLLILDAPEFARRLWELSDVLIDCVEGGASVSFMAPLTRERADRFWRGMQAGITAGERVVLAAEIDGRLVGTVTLVLAQPENQPHRADVAKMLVHRRARGHGVGRALLEAAEAVARERDKTLLVLDTAAGDAGERLYERCGWQRVGIIPHYALMPDGAPCHAVFFYRAL